jgi:hypothetical protein
MSNGVWDTAFSSSGRYVFYSTSEDKCRLGCLDGKTGKSICVNDRPTSVRKVLGIAQDRVLIAESSVLLIGFGKKFIPIDSVGGQIRLIAERPYRSHLVVATDAPRVYLVSLAKL